MELKDSSKGAVTPGVQVKIPLEEEEEIPEQQITTYRALAARANDLAQARPDVQHAVNEICRELCSPKVRSWNALKGWLGT